MDSITQIILGASIGEAVAGKKMGAKAALWGAVAGTIPDLDVFLNLIAHPIDAALLHRGFSHSMVFAFLMGPLLGALLFRLYKRKYEQKLWIKLMFWAIITHPMLDIFTNYGTEFFWPFSLRLTFNSVFVIDPLYSIPFMICVIIALFMRRSAKWRSRINWIGIGYSCLYLLWGVIVKLSILSQADGYFAKSGVHADRISVGPMPATSFYWMILGEDESNFYITYKSIFGTYSSKYMETVEKRQQKLDSLKWPEKDYAAQLKFISNDWYTMEQDADTVRFYDLRFGTATMLTNGKITTPVMGYGMVVDNGIVHKTTSIRNRGALNSLNFDAYWNHVFAKYE